MRPNWVLFKCYRLCMRFNNRYTSIPYPSSLQRTFLQTLLPLLFHPKPMASLICPSLPPSFQHSLPPLLTPSLTRLPVLGHTGAFPPSPFLEPSTQPWYPKTASSRPSMPLSNQSGRVWELCGCEGCRCCHFFAGRRQHLCEASLDLGVFTFDGGDPVEHQPEASDARTLTRAVRARAADSWG